METTFARFAGRDPEARAENRIRIGIRAPTARVMNGLIPITLTVLVFIFFLRSQAGSIVIFPGAKPQRPARHDERRLSRARPGPAS